MTILAIIILLFSIVTCCELLYGSRKLKRLAAIPHSPASSITKVSIIVPACNEEDNIEQAIRSLLQQDYPHLQIIAVNDRSTDSTGKILCTLSQQYPKLKILNIHKLPPGWLGKNNALHQGAKLADGEYLLFTDGDVSMEPSTLSRAVSRMAAEQLDHLAIIFRNSTRGSLLNGMIIDALGGLFLLLKPWRVKNPESKYFMGIGAFNMVKTTCYQKLGGHNLFRMHPIDDIMLGKLIKERGFRQECIRGEQFISVPWYQGSGEMIDGLMKNVFSLYNYNLFYLLVAAIIMISFTILPFWAALFSEGSSSYLFIASVFLRFLIHLTAGRFLGAPLSSVLWFLITPYLMLFIMMKGYRLTLKNNGIIWRGTHYSLKELRKSRQLLSIKWLLRPI